MGLGGQILWFPRKMHEFRGNSWRWPAHYLLTSSEWISFSSPQAHWAQLGMTTKDPQWWWPSLDPSLWHHREVMTKNFPSLWAVALCLSCCHERGWLEIVLPHGCAGRQDSIFPAPKSLHYVRKAFGSAVVMLPMMSAMLAALEHGTWCGTYHQHLCRYHRRELSSQELLRSQSSTPKHQKSTLQSLFS